MGPLWNALMCKAPRRMISFFPFYYTKVKFLCIDYWNICGRDLKNLTNSVTFNKYYLRIIEEDMEDTNHHTTTIEIKAFLFHFFQRELLPRPQFLRCVQRNWPPQILDFNIDPVLYTKQRWISNSLQRESLATYYSYEPSCVCALSSETRKRRLLMLYIHTAIVLKALRLIITFFKLSFFNTQKISKRKKNNNTTPSRELLKIEIRNCVKSLLQLLTEF